MTSAKHAMKSKAMIAALALSFVVCTPLAPTTARADAFKGGIIGGLGGLVVGGILGKGRGAAVGGIGGAIIGSQNKKQRRLSRPAANRSARAEGQIAAHVSLVSGIQGALLAHGYDPGPVDGRMGPGTAEAISSYQQANGLLVTGQPSKALLEHMRGVAIATAPQTTSSEPVAK